MNTRKTEFDIKKMSKETGISIPIIVGRLGVGFSRITSIDLAHELYLNALADSEIQKLALEHWNKLSLERLEKAQTLDEIRYVYNRAYSDSEARKLALTKWLELLPKDFSHVKTFEQAREAYFNTPSDTEISKLAFKNWVERCETVEQAQEAHHHDISAPKAEKLAFKKWVELCETIEQIQEAYRDTTVHSDELNALALEKWNKLSLEKLKKARTLDEVKQVFITAPYNSEAGELAFKNWVEQCETIEQVKETCERELPPHSSEARKLALEKLASFYGYVAK